MSNDKCCLFASLTSFTSNKLEHSLSSILSKDQINVVIKTTSTYQSKGVIAQEVYKLWILNDELDQKAID